MKATIKFIWKHLMKDWPLALLLFIMLNICLVLEMITPIYLGRLVNAGSSDQRNFDLLFQIALTILYFNIAGAVARSIGTSHLLTQS